MNEASLKNKQRVVDKIKSATNILITVSKDPTVDELSAALGLTALLDKLDKHATAIFSGIIPPAINFLNPDAVFENNADSLRDFIIALDKDKADHLRYKLDGDVVKIFITPYRTSINEDDLEFSQGDYNVELVLALGVASQEHLDAALVANGQIMDDATIITVNSSGNSSQLGSLDWRDESASCLCEMVAGLADALKSGKPLLDRQIATALLTGVVAATDRFSNSSTSSQVMNVAAQLMAAGADQQLIAAKLQESHAIQSLPTDTSSSTASAVTPEPSEARDDGSLVISHNDIPKQPAVNGEQGAKINRQASPAAAKPTPLAIKPEKVENEPIIEERITENKEEKPAEEPLLGGTLNATTDQAAEESKQALENDKNKTILSHSYIAGSDQPNAINGNVSATEATAGDSEAFNGSMPSSTLPPNATAPSITLPMPPPVPDFSKMPQNGRTVNPPIPQTPVVNMPQSNPGVSTLPPENPIANQPVSSGIPNTPPMPNLPNSIPEPGVSTLPPEPVASNDPGQFRIPGQQ